MSTATYEYKIDAPLETVWSVITSAYEYEAWNPFIVLVNGTFAPGGMVDMVCSLNSGRELRGEVTVTSYEFMRRFGWEMRTGLKTWDVRIETHSPTEEATDVSVTTGVKGFPLLSRGPSLEDIEDGFNRMMAALKDRVKEIAPAV